MNIRTPAELGTLIRNTRTSFRSRSGMLWKTLVKTNHYVQPIRY